ncbi:MAG TPA: PRC-barrel domain-containing protein, partial [Verrucomicrobiae bacterium]|nr:PRC-barrel domain-containing protein [Verrucomicrobiae bacterium]
KGNWLHLPKQMLTAMIQTVQTDAIKVHTPECVTAKHVCLASTLQGRKVKTVGGKLLGTVQDILLDEYSWKITGLEISDGFLSDIVTGRAVIHQPSIVTQSEHAVVVEDKLEKLWETQRN